MALRVRLSALFIATSLALVGCGGSGGDSDEGVADLSKKEILAAAKKQLAKEDFITVKGNGKNDDEGTELDVDMSFAGETADGSISVNGMEFQMLKAGGKSYFKADESFFQSSGAPAKAIELIGDKWILIDPNNPQFADLGSFVAKKEFFDELLKPDGKITKGKEKEVNGVDCVALKASKSTFYFDKSDGKPISLISNEDGDAKLDFSYDEVDEAEAPAASDVIDLASIGS
jgi:hypothetical protein